MILLNLRITYRSVIHTATERENQDEIIEEETGLM